MNEETETVLGALGTVVLVLMPLELVVFALANAVVKLSALDDREVPTLFVAVIVNE